MTRANLQNLVNILKFLARSSSSPVLVLPIPHNNVSIGTDGHETPPFTLLSVHAAKVRCALFIGCLIPDNDIYLSERLPSLV